MSCDLELARDWRWAFYAMGARPSRSQRLTVAVIALSMLWVSGQATAKQCQWQSLVFPVLWAPGQATAKDCHCRHWAFKCSESP